MSRQYFHRLAAGDFPKPLGTIGKSLVWDWKRVERWQAARAGRR